MIGFDTKGMYQRCLKPKILAAKHWEGGHFEFLATILDFIKYLAKGYSIRAKECFYWVP